MPTTLLALLVILPLAVFAWRSVTVDKSPDQVRISIDGVRWTSEIDDSLFYSETPWEPGEVRSVIVWVRNDAPVPAAVTLAVTWSAGALLVEGSELVLSATVDEGASQVFDSAKRTNKVRGFQLETGESVPVTLQAQLVSDLPEAQVIDSEAVRYRISGSGRPLEDDGSLLAAANARLILAPVFLGVAFIVAALMMSRRRVRNRAGHDF